MPVLSYPANLPARPTLPCLAPPRPCTLPGPANMPASPHFAPPLQVLYDVIAESNGFYSNPVDPAARSLMNVPFTIPSNPELEKVRATVLRLMYGHSTTTDVWTQHYH